MSCDNDILIRCEGLSKRYEIYKRPSHRLFQTLFRGHKQFYQEFWALRDVSFTLRRGESLGLIGSNGCGKSTLLQLLAGVLRPTSGTLEVNGRVSAILELGCGFNPEYTGRENIRMQASILQIPPEVLREKMAEIEAFAEIGEFMDQPLKTYSSGMTMRLAFALMTLALPEILIIDEALAVGDCFFRAKCYSHLHKLLEQGVSLIFVSHSQPEVTALCNRCILLEHGVPVLDADPGTAFERYMKSQMSTGVETASVEESSAVENISSVRQIETSVCHPPFQSRIQNRIGGISAEFTECMLMENGVEVKQFHHNTEGVIRTVVMVHEDLPDCEIGCVISTIEGVGLFSLNSFFNGENKKIGLKKGCRYFIDFHFHVALLPGTHYRIDLGLRKTVQGDYADKAFRALVFEVAPMKSLPPPLLINVPNRITLQEVVS